MLCFPWHILSKNAKKTKLASTLWYNTYKYTAYVEKKKKSEKVKVFVTQLCITVCNPMTVACQAILSTEFSRQEY